MTNLGNEIDSDSSDEEWVISSDLGSPKVINNKKAPPEPRKDRRLKISSAAIRTIKASLPPTTLPAFKPNSSKPPQSPPVSIASPISTSCDYISDEELVTICTEMDSQLLVNRLVQVYKNCEVYFDIRAVETANSVIEVRLKDHLHLCSNPCDFVINTLLEISKYFKDYAPKKIGLTPKFRRLLVFNLCSALTRFLEKPFEKIPVSNVEKDLITFDDDEEEEEPQDLISFEDIVNEPQPQQQQQQQQQDDDDVSDSDEDDDDTDDDSDEEVITLAEILGVPAELIDRYTLMHDHQIRLLKMIDTIDAPVVIYYAIEAFKLAPLICQGGEAENDGVKLCRALIQHKNYDEAVTTIRKLNLFNHFPVDATAEQFLDDGKGGDLPTLYTDKPDLQKQLLVFINKQLRFNYAGNLNIVPQEYFEDLINGTDQTPQLQRLRERKFQKELVNCGAKVMKDMNINSGDDCYFILLSQRYARLRFILASRAVQQLEDGDMSIEASANYNGLIDLVCQDDPVLARLAIKELIDMGDTIAPPYFASLYKQQEFYCRYNSLPLAQRLLGVVRGEQFSRHRASLTSKKPTKPRPERYYELPRGTKRVVVDSKSTLMLMKEVLSQSNICGLDTEWVPGFAKVDDVKTALMQIASDIDGYVFLLDLKTMYEPENAQLYRITEIILKLLFEDDEITKLAFDFSGDLDLLHTSIPSSQEWHIQSFVDLKSLKNLDGSPVSGGLAGVVSSILGVALNKRQQLSNWEKRPLTEEQAVYGAIDACCLLDVYYTLCKLNHPFVQSLPKLYKEEDDNKITIKPLNF